MCAAKTKGPELVRAAYESAQPILRKLCSGNAAQDSGYSRVSKLAPHRSSSAQQGQGRVSLFRLIHSLDSLSLATELDRQGTKQGITVHALVEVNLAAEETSGVQPMLSVPCSKGQRLVPSPDRRIDGYSSGSLRPERDASLFSDPGAAAGALC